MFTTENEIIRRSWRQIQAISILKNHNYKISNQNKQSERNSPVISLVNWFEKAKSSIRFLQDSNQSNESLTCQPKYLSSGSWIKGFQGLKHLFLALSCIWMEISSASAKNWLCLSWDRKVPLWGQTKKCWLDQLKKDIFSILNINAMFFQLNQNLTTDYLFNIHVSWSGHFPAKVRTFWETHKIKKKSSSWFWQINWFT